MSFKRHLFISYAHIDNQPLTAEQQGWITRFHQSLDAILSMRIGRKAEIWRDEKLQGNDVFEEEILEQFDQTALLIAVLSPRYLNSSWCTREAFEFCKRAEKKDGVVVENKARVFKIFKTPIDTQEPLPEVVKKVLGYEFFTLENGTPLELDPAYGEKFAQAYNRKIGTLAWDVAQMIKLMEAEVGTSQNSDITEKAEAKAMIYLAECSHDQRDAREMLEADLKLHGYFVLPHQRLPLGEETEYTEMVKQQLSQCKLSIHLIGSTCGTIPDGLSQKSTPELQNWLAVQRSKSCALQRIIWLREGLESEQVQQKAFIKSLHEDAEIQYGADLITGDFEELKSTIHETLKAIEKHDIERMLGSVEDSGLPLIYLICAGEDRKATIPLRRFLKENGLEVAIPAFSGDATAVREANHKLLKECEAVLIFYGTGDEAWKRTTDNELKKIKAYRDGVPLLASYTYLAEPQTADKEDHVEMEEACLINGLKGFSEELMKDFIRDLNIGGTIW